MRGFQGEYSPYAKRKPQLSEQSPRHRQVRVEGGGFHSQVSNGHVSGRDTETEIKQRQAILSSDFWEMKTCYKWDHWKSPYTRRVLNPRYSSGVSVGVMLVTKLGHLATSLYLCSHGRKKASPSKN